jgi:hypothetical protein
MRRLQAMSVMVCAMMALGGAAGCTAFPGGNEAKAAPQSTGVAAAPATGAPPVRAADPVRPKPVIFDPYATPFAVVEKDKGSCALPLHAEDWRIEPPLPSPANAKTPGKTGATRKAGATDPTTGKATTTGPTGKDPAVKDPTTKDPTGKPNTPGDVAQAPSAANQAGIEIDATGETPRRLGPGIKPYCVYRWKKPGFPTRADFKAIGAVPDKAIIGGTPSAAKGAVPKLPRSVWQPLEKIFADQAHGIDPQRWRALLKRHSPADRVPVRVAVVDATRVGLKGVDPSLHGTVVSYVVGTLLCGDPRKPECAERVRPYLALPMKTQADADPNGGYWGTFSQLADALGNALADWDVESEHLVINLSLGWDPLKLDRNDPHQRRVEALLSQASCLGAVTVAAAGNPTGSDGAIYPGRFEELAAPDQKECAKLGIKAPASRWASTKKAAPPPADLYEPLVHSVGAVDNQDQRLLSNRRWGQPRLAALGLAVTVPGDANTPFLPPFTGTSVSTAIVSGVAAAVWSLRPELTASEVMDIVYRGGVALDGLEKSKRAQTEYCAKEHYGCPDRPQVHRVYLCGAVAQALQDKAPAEKLACKSDVSTAFPAWPKPSRTLTAQGPCRIANCGLPVGPVTDESARADVAPHGGFASCPGCTVILSGGLAVLTGIVFPPDVMDPGLIPELRISITGRYSATDFIVPGVPFNQDMAITGMTMPERPAGAVLTVSYWNVGAIDHSDPEFSVPFIKLP